MVLKDPLPLRPSSYDSGGEGERREEVEEEGAEHLQVNVEEWGGGV